MERGLNIESGILTIIDGSKALAAAVKSVFGNKALIQRCQIHKIRNVMDYLPEDKKEWARKNLRQAWNTKDYLQAKQRLETLAQNLEKSYPNAAASIREGLEETLTVNKLDVPASLLQTLRSTNPIESTFNIFRQHSRNVKNWQTGSRY